MLFRSLERSVELIAEIHDGIPPRRNRRLVDAHDRYETFRPAYLRNLLLFLQVPRQFIAEKPGPERDFDALYSAPYLLALARYDPTPLHRHRGARRRREPQHPPPTPA